MFVRLGQVRGVLFPAIAAVALGPGLGAGGCGSGQAPRPDAGAGGHRFDSGGAGTGGAGASAGGASTGGAGAGTGGAGTGGGTGGAAASTGGAGPGTGGAGAGTGGGVAGAAGGGRAGAASGGRGGAGGAGGAAGTGSGGRGGGGDAGGAGGSSVTYTGCTFVGGINRVVIAKRDAARDLCVVLVLGSPATNPFNLTLPPNTGTEYAYAMRAQADCRQRFPPAGMVPAIGGMGSVVSLPTPQPTYSIDVTLMFSPDPTIGVAATERLAATNVLASLGCP
jgi:hypothetical protein